jgi:hypothetical protein
MLALSCSRFPAGTRRMGDWLDERTVLDMAYYNALTRNRALLIQSAAPLLMTEP